MKRRKLHRVTTFTWPSHVILIPSSRVHYFLTFLMCCILRVDLSQYKFNFENRVFRIRQTYKLSILQMMQTINKFQINQNGNQTYADVVNNGRNEAVYERTRTVWQQHGGIYHMLSWGYGNRFCSIHDLSPVYIFLLRQFHRFVTLWIINYIALLQ